MYLKFPLDIENSVFYLRYKTYHIRKVFWIERSNVKGSLGTLGTLVGLSRHLQEQSTNEKISTVYGRKFRLVVISLEYTTEYISYEFGRGFELPMEASQASHVSQISK